MPKNDPAMDLRAVPADQRTQGPNETMIISTGELALALASAGSRVRIEGRPKLNFRSGPLAGRTFELSGDRTMIGRRDDNDIIIEHSTVSSRHCQIVNQDGIWRVVNLISTNGTAVNGRNGAVSYLAPGDVMTLGKIEILFEADQEDGTERVKHGGLAGAVKVKRTGRHAALIWSGVGVLFAVSMGMGAGILGWF